MHAPAQRRRDGEALHDNGVQRLAAEIQEAVGEAQVLGVVGLAEHGDGKLLGFRQHLDLGGVELDLTRRQLGVGRALGALAHLAVDADDPLGAHGLGGLEGGAVGIGHDLRQAVMVAKIDEQHAAVVAHAVDPARKARRLADIARAQGPACARPIFMRVSRRPFLPLPSCRCLLCPRNKNAEKRMLPGQSQGR